VMPSVPSIRTQPSYQSTAPSEGETPLETLQSFETETLTAEGAMTGDDAPRSKSTACTSLKTQATRGRTSFLTNRQADRTDAEGLRSVPGRMVSKRNSAMPGNAMLVAADDGIGREVSKREASTSVSSSASKDELEWGRTRLGLGRGSVSNLSDLDLLDDAELEQRALALEATLADVVAVMQQQLLSTRQLIGDPAAPPRNCNRNSPAAARLAGDEGEQVRPALSAVTLSGPIGSQVV